jgi:hypothetical protein
MLSLDVPGRGVREVQETRERHRIALPRRHVALGRGVDVAAQIVMAAEQSPSGSRCFMDPEFNRRSSPKGPPVEPQIRRVVHPIGIEPVDDVVVAGQGDEPRAAPLPERLGHGGTGDAGGVAIHDAGELVEDHGLRVLEHEPGELAAELLAVRQVGEPLEPVRRAREPDRGQGLRDRLAVERGREPVDDRRVLGPLVPLVEQGVGEGPAADGRLAGPGRPDDQADLPGFLLDGDVHVPLVPDGRAIGHVEHSPYLRNAETRPDGRLDQNVITRHRNPSLSSFSKTSR